MGWSIGYDARWQRDIGYGVPSLCDQPVCTTLIDRGIAYVCGGEPYGGEKGCGLYFCGAHLFIGGENSDPQMCERCCNVEPPFDPKPDVDEWLQWKLTDRTWDRWRQENPELVAAYRARLSKEEA